MLKLGDVIHWSLVQLKYLVTDKVGHVPQVQNCYIFAVFKQRREVVVCRVLPLQFSWLLSRLIQVELFQSFTGGHGVQVVLCDNAVAQINLSYTPLENDKIYFLVENLILKFELLNSHVRQKLSLYLCTRAASCDPLRAPRFARRRRSPSFKLKSRAISNNAMYQKNTLRW